MFTGIITDTTDVVDSQPVNNGLTLTFAKPAGWKDLALGESVATNGVCLTVAAQNKDTYQCYLVPETLDKTAFGKAVPKRVNLERSLRAADRFGGHFVQGHVDGIGEVTGINKRDGWRLSVKFTTKDKPLVVYKGAICIDGVSLTVADVKKNRLTVALVPHTLEHTTLKSLRVGDKVNLEFDMVGKYIINFLKQRAK